jgi:hypothetical protein
VGQLCDRPELRFLVTKLIVSDTTPTISSRRRQNGSDNRCDHNQQKQQHEWHVAPKGEGRE